jgi:hypothetical protein
VIEKVEAMANRFKIPRQRWLSKPALLRELKQLLKLESFMRAMG